MKRSVIRILLGTALVCLTAAVAVAQQTSTTTATKKFQVIAVDGNKLVVKLPEGTKELTVPDDFRFNIDGKMMSVHELKPGMAGTATITTKITQIPVTVTEVKNGTVLKAMGTAVIVRTDNGVQMFSQGDLDKRGVKIFKDGKPADIFDLHANDVLSATIVTSMPPKILTEQQVQATLAAAPGAAGGGAGAPAGKAATPQKAQGKAAGSSSGAASTQTGSTAPHKASTLPKTASPLPLLGLMGLLSLAAGLGLTARRRRIAR
jgi:LPXTG-motif cell wall-anchored protein